MRRLAIMIAVMLAGCNDEPQRIDETQRGEAIDYSQINRQAAGPGVKIDPDAMTEQVIADSSLDGAGCAVMRGSDLVFLARADTGHMLIDGEGQRLAPRPARERMHGGIAQHYDGLEYSVELRPGDATGAVSETGDAVITIIIRDAKNRPVFEETGTLDCS